jgi:predicted AAA+ superfamily ATPase
MREIPRFFKPGKHSFFLFGPRGTGKSTLMKKLYPNALWVDFLKPQIERTYLSRPETIYDLLAANPDINQVVIDEVQRVPGILTAVHDIIESESKRQFILTGSSARKIKRAGADLLGGRALHYTLHPFMASELDSEFNLSNALQTGLLPLIYQAESKQEILDAYISLYLDQEVKAEGLTRDIGNFSRFLETFSFSHGTTPNMSNIARECMVSRKTAENYLTILEDLLLVHKLPVFTLRAKRDLIKNHKVYYFDAGVYNTLRPKGYLENVDSIVGPCLEGLVLQNLIAWRDYSSNKNEIYFWATRTGLEVDFIIYNETELLAIEVKNATHIAPHDIKGLRAFQKDYPMSNTVFLYRGDQKIMQHGILCIPVADFLIKILPNKSISEIFL